jgi:hypothetical protein
MVDSQSLLHLPRWARVIALALLLSTLATAIFVTVHFVRTDDPANPKYTDWVLVGMSLVQLALSGLAVALVLFYSEREVNAKTLLRKAESILDEDVTHTLTKVTAEYDLREHASQVKRLGPSDIFGAAYEITSGAHRTKVWVGLNVTRLFTIFWIAVPADEEDEARFVQSLQHVFEFTFGGAQRVGYHTNFEAATVRGTRVVSIWSSVDTGHNLLLEPSRRVFWLHDVAMMVESFWRTSIRHGLSTSGHDPSPL